MTNEEKRIIRRVEKAVTRAHRRRLIYKLGGGRDWVNKVMLPLPGFGKEYTDCSGWADYLCEVAGIKLREPIGWTGTQQYEGKEGYGNLMTFFIKEPNSIGGHIIIRLRRRPRWWTLGRGAPRWRWTQCGGRDNRLPGGGPCWFRPTQARVNEFPIRRAIL